MALAMLIHFTTTPCAVLLFKPLNKLLAVQTAHLVIIGSNKTISCNDTTSDMCAGSHMHVDLCTCMAANVRYIALRIAFGPSLIRLLVIACDIKNDHIPNRLHGNLLSFSLFSHREQYLAVGHSGN